MSRAVVAGVAGVITAGAAQFLAAVISGAGHAWGEPFFFSAAMWVMFPLMFIRVQQHRAGSDELAPLDWLVMLLAIALDVLLVIATIEREEPLLPMFGTGTERFVQVFLMDPVLLALWIALWLSWQIAALFLCIRGRGGR